MLTQLLETVEGKTLDGKTLEAATLLKEFQEITNSNRAMISMCIAVCKVKPQYFKEGVTAKKMCLITIAGVQTSKGMEIVNAMCHLMIEKCNCKLLTGQAPRSALERQAQEFLDK